MPSKGRPGCGPGALSKSTGQRQNRHRNGTGRSTAAVMRRMNASNALRALPSNSDAPAAIATATTTTTSRHRTPARKAPMSDPNIERIAIDRGKDGEALVAKHGQFSEKFFRAMSAALHKAPTIVEHVVSLITASGGGQDRVDGTRDAPLPMSIHAFADVNEIYSLLVYWSRVFAAALAVQAPGVAVRAWRNDRGTILGLQPDITPAVARYEVGIMATWLTIHLEAICGLDADDVMAFHSGATDVAPARLMKSDGGLRTIFQVDARWPQEDKPRYSDMPCPDDGGKVALYPPLVFGDDERASCESCGRLFSLEQYEELVIAYRKAATEEKSTASVARHLMRKYGIAAGHAGAA